jgi:hypothetical protein
VDRSSAAQTSEPVIRQPYTCSDCNGQWFDHHFCPSMPWGKTAPGPIFVSIPQVTINGTVKL